MKHSTFNVLDIRGNNAKVVADTVEYTDNYVTFLYETGEVIVVFPRENLIAIAKVRKYD